MFRRILTHFIILMLTVLPVQVISADVENSNMKMSMMDMTQLEMESMHAMTSDSSQKMTNSCCDEVSFQCDNCGDDCPKVANAISIMLSQSVDKIHSLNTQKFFVSHLLLNGIPQNNLLRPPRTLI